MNTEKEAGENPSNSDIIIPGQLSLIFEPLIAFQKVPQHFKLIYNSCFYWI